GSQVTEEEKRLRDTKDHGTHTAGCMCGGVIGRTAIGAAPGAQLCSCIVIEGGAPGVRVLAGIDWAIERAGVRVLSMALGIRGYNKVFERVISRCIRRNILPVVAIGNE